MPELPGAEISLLPIDPDGSPRGYDGELPAMVEQVCRATANLYARAGFLEPWIGYIAMRDRTPVGACSFKSPPCNGRAEVAYFTFPGHEGRGIASAMAARLVALAQEHEPAIIMAAQTLPARNASHRILEKLGFRHVDTLQHPEDGTVWEWQLPQASSPLQPFRRPPADAVRALLAAAGLPVADLGDDMSHFHGCGTPAALRGAVGLELHGSDALLRSLVVDPAQRGRGFGKALVEAAERHARASSVRHIYLLTETAETFFESLGYQRIPRESVPAAIRASHEFAILCPASAACMSKALD
jgi:[ribosomal protein S5]-alanine N-acetyltransferase